MSGMEPNGYPNAGVPPQSVVPQSPIEPKRGFNFNFPLIMGIVGVLLVLVLVGGLIYFLGQANQSQSAINEQVTAAIEQAKQEQGQADEAAFVEREKQPFRSYEGPAVLGGLKVEFPKTWNVFAIEDEKASTQLDIFMYPGVVRSEKSTTEPYAFRLKLEQKLYTDTIKKYQSLVDK